MKDITQLVSKTTCIRNKIIVLSSVEVEFRAQSLKLCQDVVMGLSSLIEDPAMIAAFLHAHVGFRLVRLVDVGKRETGIVVVLKTFRLKPSYQ